MKVLFFIHQCGKIANELGELLGKFCNCLSYYFDWTTTLENIKVNDLSIVDYCSFYLLLLLKPMLSNVI